MYIRAKTRVVSGTSIILMTIWGNYSHTTSEISEISERLCSNFLILLMRRDPRVTYWRLKVKVSGTQSCLTLCDPLDCILPGSSVHRILQASILDCVAIPFSMGSSWPRDPIRVFHISGRFFTVWTTGKPHCRLVSWILNKSREKFSLLATILRHIYVNISGQNLASS